MFINIIYKDSVNMINLILEGFTVKVNKDDILVQVDESRTIIGV